MKGVINKVLELTSAGYLLTQQPLTDSQQVMLIHSNSCLAELLQTYELRLACQGLSEQKIKNSNVNIAAINHLNATLNSQAPPSQPTVFATSDDLTPWSGCRTDCQAACGVWLS